MRLKRAYTKKPRKSYIASKAGKFTLAPVFKCCQRCDQLFMTSSRNMTICSDLCRKELFDKVQRKKVKTPRCACGNYTRKEFRYVHCSDACKIEYRKSKFIAVTPNGQVFDNSNVANPSVPNIGVTSCIDCGQWGYVDTHKRKVPKRCKRCNALHGSKIQAVKKTAKYEKLYSEGYVPYKVRSDNHKQRAIKFNVEYDPSVTIGAVTDKYNNECQECGITMQQHAGGWHPEGWTIGHIIPMSLGGDHTWDNVQAECHACNMWKGNRELEVDWTVLNKN